MTGLDEIHMLAIFATQPMIKPLKFRKLAVLLCHCVEVSAKNELHSSKSDLQPMSYDHSTFPRVPKGFFRTDTLTIESFANAFAFDPRELESRRKLFVSIWIILSGSREQVCWASPRVRSRFIKRIPEIFRICDPPFGNPDHHTEETFLAEKGDVKCEHWHIDLRLS